MECRSILYWFVLMEIQKPISHIKEQRKPPKVFSESNCNRDPKDAIDNVLSEKGVMLRAQSVGDMQRNLKQQKILKSLGNDYTNVHDIRDMLYVVMQQCKNAEKVDIFVQDVTCALATT